MIRRDTIVIDPIEIIQALKGIVGAIACDGDASVQVMLPTKDGRYFRLGYTDDDVAAYPGKLWLVTERYQDK